MASGPPPASRSHVAPVVCGDPAGSFVLVPGGCPLVGLLSVGHARAAK